MYAIDANTRAFLFDVFGTCVDWRKTVTNALYEASERTLADPASSIAPAVRQKASALTKEAWGDFAQEWRTTYYHFTRSLARDPSLSWKTVDDHNLDSLRILLHEHGLAQSGEGGDDSEVVGNLWTDAQVRSMSTIWHRLDPWADTVEGLEILGMSYATVTLSNGNISLLKDMQAHSGMRFTHTFSSELFGTYKPNPAIYKGAAEKLGLDVRQCVMVAAHLGDLEAAKAVGMQTAYIERPQEEASEKEEEAKNKGFVDVWVEAGEGGFVGLCQKLGIVDQVTSNKARRRSWSAPAATTDPEMVPH